MNLDSVPETPDRDEDARTLQHVDSVQPEHSAEHIIDEGFIERQQAKPIDTSKTGPEPSAAFRDDQISHPNIKPVSVDNSQDSTKVKSYSKKIVLITMGGILLVLLMLLLLLN